MLLILLMLLLLPTHYKMAKWRAANLLLLAALALLLRTRGASIEVENDAQEEKELHLSRIKDAYSFLEASLNALEVNTPHSLDEAVPKKLSQKQLGYAHHEMLKKLKLQKLNNITNIRNVIIRCVSDSRRDEMGSGEEEMRWVAMGGTVRTYRIRDTPNDDIPNVGDVI
ncbi:hypothetical protein PVIIG_06517 [Plasmodium vivax India VII]|uniref:Uncharacterized protein n=1 Tax=Plasmodium vivax India VII TaxID=1077284 RepID=A0A0J9SCV6_PLAVI|nr:hypothetical protein PVIIG_06517 [Plasmodium vivax India VII]